MTNKKVDAILKATGGDIGDLDERATIHRVVANGFDVASILMTVDDRPWGDAGSVTYPACDDSQQAAFQHRTTE